MITKESFMDFKDHNYDYMTPQMQELLIQESKCFFDQGLPDQEDNI